MFYLHELAPEEGDAVFGEGMDRGQREVFA